MDKQGKKEEIILSEISPKDKETLEELWAKMWEGRKDQHQLCTLDPTKSIFINSDIHPDENSTYDLGIVNRHQTVSNKSLVVSNDTNTYPVEMELLNDYFFDFDPVYQPYTQSEEPEELYKRVLGLLCYALRMYDSLVQPSTQKVQVSSGDKCRYEYTNTWGQPSCGYTSFMGIKCDSVKRTFKEKVNPQQSNTGECGYKVVEEQHKGVRD